MGSTSAERAREGSGDAGVRRASSSCSPTVLGALLALAGPALPGGELARAVASKLVCAVRGTGDCGERASELAAQPTPLERVYGAELAALLAERVADDLLRGRRLRLPAGRLPRLPRALLLRLDPPRLARAHPDRPRADRLHPRRRLPRPGRRPPRTATTAPARAPATSTSSTGSTTPTAGPTASAGSAATTTTTGRATRCGSLRTGRSWPAPAPTTATTAAAAVSEHRQRHRLGAAEPAWDTVLGQLHVAAGSHAGCRSRRRATAAGSSRATSASPARADRRRGRAPPFAVSPPWEKAVWRDPGGDGHLNRTLACRTYPHLGRVSASRRPPRQPPRTRSPNGWRGARAHAAAGRAAERRAAQHGLLADPQPARLGPRPHRQLRGALARPGGRRPRAARRRARPLLRRDREPARRAATSCRSCAARSSAPTWREVRERALEVLEDADVERRRRSARCGTASSTRC